MRGRLPRLLAEAALFLRHAQASISALGEAVRGARVGVRVLRLEVRDHRRVVGVTVWCRGAPLVRM